MARRSRVFASGLVYHVIARGNRREAVFQQPGDYRVYLDRLARYRRRFEAAVHAYCLMPNHVHILIQAGPPPLAKLMQAVQQSYTQYFNRAYTTVGHVFQGRYKALVCHRDPYLVALLRYIHLNPVRAGLVTRAEDYPYSSHVLYLRGRTTALIDPTPVLGILGGSAAYRELMREASADPLGPTPGLDLSAPERDHRPALDAAGVRSVRLPVRPLSAVITQLARRLGVQPAVVGSIDRGWGVSRARALIVFVLVRRLGYPVTAVAQALGRPATSISVLLSRTADRLEADARLMAEADNLSRNV
jgi:REP element-mobilizing transposase RayT